MHIKAVRKIHRIFKDRGLSLSVAESCTGGLICHCLTALPGASVFFKAGAVTYSVSSKHKMLGIPMSVMTDKGIVSRDTACRMAEGIRKRIGTDVSLATTGNLGPEVLENRPVGLIYAAVCVKGRTHTRRLMLEGSRSRIKSEAVLAAFELLLEKISDD